jgi:hypothetical protein
MRSSREEEMRWARGQMGAALGRWERIFTHEEVLVARKGAKKERGRLLIHSSIPVHSFLIGRWTVLG